MTAVPCPGVEVPAVQPIEATTSRAVDAPAVAVDPGSLAVGLLVEPAEVGGENQVALAVVERLVDELRVRRDTAVEPATRRAGPHQGSGGMSAMSIEVTRVPWPTMRQEHGDPAAQVGMQRLVVDSRVDAGVCVTDDLSHPGQMVLSG